MAYDQRGNMLQYFAPVGSAALDVEAITTAAVHGQLVCVEPCTITRIMFMLTVIVASDATLGVVEFNHRPLIGSGTGETAIGTLTFPDTTAVGQMLYKDITPYKFEAGDVLSLEVLTAADDAGAQTGSGHYAAICEMSPETIAANSDTKMVESA